MRRGVRIAAIAILGGWMLSLALSLLTVPLEYGSDYTLYMERARSWLAGDGFYQGWQLAGPYPIQHGAVTYPPIALALFVPFTVLPSILWWAVPLGLSAYCLWRLRPNPWILAVVLAYNRTWAAVLLGNPSMWSFAFLLAGLVWGWPAALVPIKATLAPFALAGAPRRSWVIASVLFFAACLPFGAMWFDYAAVLANAQQTPYFGFAYVYGEIPIALGLILACRWRNIPRVRVRTRRMADRLALVVAWR